VALPTGTVTLVFCDVAATGLLRHARSDRYGEGLGPATRLLRRSLVQAGGLEVDAHGGDEVFTVFTSPEAALLAVVQAQRALAAQRGAGDGEVTVRMGVHTGEPVALPFGYTGDAVHHAARICTAASVGQVLVSEATHDALTGAPAAGIELRDLGLYHVAGDARAQRLFQLVADGLGDGFEPLRGLVRHR
jgi:class 3 adenylate cyclase